ncbi:hypothetical protein GGF37_001475 [Kickxella alabastrina]|nr:hypothetical protein GGF37_001475 [Kickxella alabastrina]
MSEPPSRGQTEQGAFDDDARIKDMSSQHCFAASTVTAVDAAGIRVLLVPIGAARQDRLTRWTNAIAQFSQVELSDLLAHVDNELLTASYGGSSGGEGALRFMFTTNVSEEHEYLEGLQTYRQVLGVIGLIDCEANEDIVAAQDEFMQMVSQLPTAVAYRCLAFDPQADQADDVSGVTVIPNGDESLSFYLQTLVSDFAGTMVSALSLMSRSIEDRANLQTPTEPSPAHSPSVVSSLDNDTASANGHFRHSGGNISMHETTEAAAHSIARRASQVVSKEQRRESTTSLPTGCGRRGGELDRDIAAPPSPKIITGEKRAQKPNDTAGAGRLKKLQGDLFLMSGRLAEAFSAYAASIEASRAVGDHLWHAVAVEGYCAALLLLCERPQERRLAAAFVSGIPDVIAPIDGSISPQSAGLGALLAQIGSLFAQVPVLYERCYTFAPLLHAEACLRAALVLHATREAFLHDDEAALASLVRLRNQVDTIKPERMEFQTRDVVANTRNIPLRATINEWLQRGWASSFESLALTDQLEMSAETSALFRRIGYSRKAFFFLRQFLLLAIPVLLRTATAQRHVGAPAYSMSPRSRPSVSSRTDHTALSAFPDGFSAFNAVSSAAAAAASARNMAMHSPAGSPNPMRSSFDVPVFGDFLASPAREWFSKPRPSLHHAVVACLDALVYSFELGSTHSDGSGWMHLQADVLRECLAIAEALPSYPHAIATAFRLVRCLSHLSAIVPDSQRRPLFDEQHMLRVYLSRTIGLFHQRYHFDPAGNTDKRAETLSVDSADSNKPRVIGRDASVVGGVLNSLLVGIQFCTFPNNPMPIAVSRKQDSAAKTASSLFLYNPSAQALGDMPPLLVAHEETHFVATLSNPFPFALPLTDILLIGHVEVTPAADSDNNNNHDATVVSQSTQCVIPPNSTGQVLLVATPRAFGQLKILGIKLSLFQHLAIKCMLAEEDEHKATRRMKERPIWKRLEAERNSLLSLDKPLPDSPAVRLSVMNSGHLLHTRVVPALPKLAVIESSLAFEDSLSLCEGESRVVTLTLVNGSDMAAVDRLGVAFEPLVSADGNKWADETRADSQLGDLTNAAFSYLQVPSEDNGNSMCIGPKSIYRLKVRVSGISGLSGGEIVVRYGSAATAEWSRELRWPLRVSVVRLLAPVHDSKPRAAGSGDSLTARYSTLPPYISRALATPDDAAVSNSSRDLVTVLREAFSEQSPPVTASGSIPEAVHCAEDSFLLAEINLANMGSTDVELTVETDLSDKSSNDAYSLSSGKLNPSALVKSLVVHMPGRKSLSRIFVPLPRVRLDDHVLRSAVPGLEAHGGPDRAIFYPWRQSLLHTVTESDEKWSAGIDSRGNDRQFVLTNTRDMSEQDLEHHREIYWYRQEICNRVRLHWACHQSGRSGFIDPRTLFAPSEGDMDIIRRRGLDIRVSVNGVGACRVGARLIRAQCNSGHACDVEFQLTNRFSRDLDLEISVLVVRDVEDDDIPLVSQNSTALFSPNSNARLLVNENQALAFVPFDSATSQSAAASNGDFAFVLSEQMTDNNELPKTQKTFAQPLSPNLPALELFDDLVFDDISGMRLPKIPPGASHSVSMPLYILCPGNYKIKYTVREHSRSEAESGETVFVREVLAIDSNQ